MLLIITCGRLLTAALMMGVVGLLRLPVAMSEAGVRTANARSDVCAATHSMPAVNRWQCKCGLQQLGYQRQVMRASSPIKDARGCNGRFVAYPTAAVPVHPSSRRAVLDVGQAPQRLPALGLALQRLVAALPMAGALQACWVRETPAALLCAAATVGMVAAEQVVEVATAAQRRVALALLPVPALQTPLLGGCLAVPPAQRMCLDVQP
jgi:hypothetical protein